MSTIEVMRKAREALEHAEKDAADFQRINTDQTGAAITALRAEIERLEAAEPGTARPACLDGRCPDRRECDVARACLHHTPPNPPAKPAAAEPAAIVRTWRKPSAFTGEIELHAELIDWRDGLYALPDGEHLLYTAPTQPAAAEPVALGAPIAPEHDAELAAHAERAEQLHAEFLLAQKTYAYNTPGIARCARMAATPEGRRLLDAGRVFIGLEPIWEPAFAAAPPAAIPALTEVELDGNSDGFYAGARWAYALAAERAGARIE